MGVLTELGVAGPVPLVFDAPALADQTQQGVWRGADAGEEQVRLTVRCPPAFTVSVITSTIQAQPGQFALMCSGASLADSSQSVSRPWRFS